MNKMSHNTIKETTGGRGKGKDKDRRDTKVALAEHQ
jgi:hypothetical protein